MLKKLLYSPKTTTLYPYILILTPIAVAAVTTASTGTWTYTPAAWWVTFSLLMLGHGIWFYTMSANNFGKPTLYESCDEHGRPTKQAFDIAKQTYGRIHHHAHTHLKLWTAAAYIYAAASANTYGIIPAIPAIYLLSRPLSKKIAQHKDLTINLWLATPEERIRQSGYYIDPNIQIFGITSTTQIAFQGALITLICTLGNTGTLGHIHNLDDAYITTAALTLWIAILKFLPSTPRQQYYS